MLRLSFASSVPGSADMPVVPLRMTARGQKLVLAVVVTIVVACVALLGFMAYQGYTAPGCTGQQSVVAVPGDTLKGLISQHVHRVNYDWRDIVAPIVNQNGTANIKAGQVITLPESCIGG